jgi:hypothetical protein
MSCTELSDRISASVYAAHRSVVSTAKCTRAYLRHSAHATSPRSRRSSRERCRGAYARSLGPVDGLIVQDRPSLLAPMEGGLKQGNRAVIRCERKPPDACGAGDTLRQADRRQAVSSSVRMSVPTRIGAPDKHRYSLNESSSESMYSHAERYQSRSMVSSRAFCAINQRLSESSCFARPAWETICLQRDHIVVPLQASR